MLRPSRLPYPTPKATVRTHTGKYYVSSNSYYVAKQCRPHPTNIKFTTSQPAFSLHAQLMYRDKFADAIETFWMHDPHASFCKWSWPNDNAMFILRKQLRHHLQETSFLDCPVHIPIHTVANLRCYSSTVSCGVHGTGELLVHIKQKSWYVHK